MHIAYDGVNGQLPNLDLINSVVSIAGGQMGMGTTIQEMWGHSDRYGGRLKTMLRGMVKQGLGHASGPHSSFIPYHVDAVTLQPYGDGWHDEMAMGRLIEGSFRSLNNLLEHLHQSFFFYLLMHKERFVSIGTYLPSAMLVAANFTIMAISLWVKSGHKEEVDEAKGTPNKSPAKKASSNSDDPEPPPATAPAVERDLFLPLGFVAVCQFIGVVPLYIFNHTPASVRITGFPSTCRRRCTDTLHQMLSLLFAFFTAVNCALPHVLAHILTIYYNPSVQQFRLIKSFSLLLLGMFLSSLATLNFSLAFLVGVLASPLSFMQPWPKSTGLRWAASAFLNAMAPPAVLYVAAASCGMDIGYVLREAAFGWDVWGMYTPVVVWCVWWPAWLAGSALVLGQPPSVTATSTTK